MIQRFKQQLLTVLLVTLVVASMNFPHVTMITAKAATENIATSSIAEDIHDSDVEIDSDILLIDDVIDDEAPIINSIEVETDEVVIPGTLKFTVNISEDESGIKSITARFENLSVGRYANKTYRFDPGSMSGDYELEYTFTDYTLPAGDWIIMLMVSDNEGNSTGFESFNNGIFYLNGNDDFTSPSIEDVRMIRENIEVPDSIEIEVDASDDSGIKSITIGLIGEDDNGNTSKSDKTFKFDPDKSQDTYLCKVPISKNAVSGKWKIRMLTVCDKVNNWTDGSLQNEWLEQYCNVINYYRDDNEKPVINEIKFNESNGRIPYDLEIIADVVEDGSGLSSFNIRLTNNSGDQNKWISVPITQNNGKSGTYNAIVRFDDQDHIGTWIVDNVSIVDKVYNSNQYYDFDCKFELLDKEPVSQPVDPDIDDPALPQTPIVPSSPTESDKNQIVSGNKPSYSGSGGSGGGGSSSSKIKTTTVQTVSNNIYPTLIVTNPYIYDGTWEQVGDKWKIKYNDKYIESSWVFLNKKWYLIGSDAYMVTGWAFVNNKWYYLNTDGSMQIERCQIDSKWYDFKENGEWIEI